MSQTRLPNASDAKDMTKQARVATEKADKEAATKLIHGVIAEHVHRAIKAGAYKVDITLSRDAVTDRLTDILSNEFAYDVGLKGDRISDSVTLTLIWSWK